MAKLKPCCNRCLPWDFDTHFLGFRIKTTVFCTNCGYKASGRTIEKAFEKWNRRYGGKENAVD